MNKRWKILIFIVVILGLMSGLRDLRLDVDVFNLLPRDSLMVDGLKVYQKAFGSSAPPL